MIKDKIITIILAIIIIILLAIIGFLGFKIVVQGYSFGEVIDSLKGTSEEESQSSNSNGQVTTGNDVNGEAEENTLTNDINDANTVNNGTSNESGEYVLNENRAVDLTALKNYSGTGISYDITRQLMLLVISDYKQYIADTASDGDIIAIEFSKITDKEETEKYAEVIRSYMAEVESEQNRGTFTISFSIGKNGNEILTIDRNTMLEVN